MMVVVEGDTDLPYVRKLVSEAGLTVTSEVDAGGKGSIDRDLKKYNAMAKTMPLLVVRDLDHDAPCGGTFVAQLKLKQSRWLRLRVAVRELEAWVLADAVGLSKFLGVDAKWLPEDPDSETNPTRSLLSIATRSPARIRRKLLPEKGSAAVVGPLYEAALIEFGELGWDAARAAKRSPSLRRARASLKTLAVSWHAFIDPP